MVEIIVAIIVAIQTIIQVVIQKVFSSKSDIENLTKLIEEQEKKSNERDDELDKKYKNIAMMYAKTYLIDLMSRIQKGEKVNDEQIRLLYELKETYNNAGGDSYVDDMFDKLKANKLI